MESGLIRHYLAEDADHLYVVVIFKQVNTSAIPGAVMMNRALTHKHRRLHSTRVAKHDLAP